MASPDRWMVNSEKAIYERLEKSPTASTSDWFKELPNGYDEEDVIDLKCEGLVAYAYGWKRRDRGPPPPWCGGPETWRGQTCRANGVWANRGGKNVEKWAKYDQKMKGSRQTTKTAKPKATQSKGLARSPDLRPSSSSSSSSGKPGFPYR